MTSGPDERRDGDRDGARQLRIRRAADAHGDGAQAFGFRDGAKHIGRAAAGGDSHQHVGSRETAGARGRARQWPDRPRWLRWRG